MSRWRQKGFVLDSDEEDGDSLESQKDAGLGRVERVKDDHNDVEQQASFAEKSQDTERRRPTTPKKMHSLKRPTPSPITPTSTFELRREPTESPDPLQISPTQRINHIQSPTLQKDSLFPATGHDGDDNVVEGLQFASETPKSERRLADGNVHKATNTSRILKEFGIALLSDNSDDEPLSDPPSDLDSPPPVPHRRTTLQVLIPSSTLEQIDRSEHRYTRDFRQRKPIQLHPYALEGELYRREVQSRGLKPVPRARSPSQDTRHNETETQETEFNPNESPRSSQPEIEILVSTPPKQRLQKTAPNISSAHHLDSHPMRRLTSTQLHLPPATKKRKLNPSATQIPAVPASIFDVEAIRRDDWLIPPNSPPYSSSPLTNDLGSARRLNRLRANIFTTNIPTPSTSSIVLDDPQQFPESDSDPIPHSVQKSGGGVRRVTRIVLSDSDSAATDSASNPEQSDNELRNVKKKIKGVLPASWLRFDQQTQERRKIEERERQRALLNVNLFPDSTELQRGVAQRIKKRVGRPRKASTDNTPSRDIVTISDESDDEPSVSDPRYGQLLQDSLEDASALAAIFDNRYADDTLSDMENDRLHLPTLGGTAPKRKRQSKLMDTLGKVKKRKATTNAFASEDRTHGRTTRKQSFVRSRPSRRTPPPAMSVIDMNISPSKQGGNMPQFLRIARRQALQRPDLARQSPTNKQIRLHNACDTEEANTTLQQWFQGLLKPNDQLSSKRQLFRQALADKPDNQQLTQSRYSARKGALKDLDTRSVIEEEPSQRPRRKRVSPGLEMFKRSSPHSARTLLRKQKVLPSSKGPKNFVSKAAPSFRTAQLEDNEKNTGRGQQRVVLQKGLRSAERQYGGPFLQERSRQNPVLARFLADNDANLPCLPSTEDIGEIPENSPQKRTHLCKNRVSRKPCAHRVDIDAREYRQPSEPAVGDVVKPLPSISLDDDAGQNQAILQGLSPSGTQYPVTFDVQSLLSETYFQSSTFIGSEEFRRALSVGTVHGRDLDESAGYCSITHDIVSFRCGPWNDQTYSGIQCLMKAIWAPLEDQSNDVEPIPNLRKDVLENSARFLRSVIAYQTEHLSFLDPIDRTDFVVKMTDFSKSIFDRLLNMYAAISEQDCTSDHARNCIRALSYLLVLSVEVRQIARHQIIEPGQCTDLVATINSLSKLTITHLVRHGIPELSNFLETNKRHAVRMKGVKETDILAEIVVVNMHILESIEFPRLGFWQLVSQELSSAVAKATHTHTFESAWATLFTFLPFIEFDVSGIPSRDKRQSFHSDDWTGIRDLLKRLIELHPETSKRQSSLLNDYVRANLARCHRLVYYWHWRQPEQMLNVVLDFFSKNKLKLLRREANGCSVAFLESLASEQSFVLLSDENSFHIALKCLALGLREMKNTLPEKKVRSFVFRSIPNHGRTYPKDQPLDEESLAALRNHHDLLATLYWAAPPPCRPKLDHIRHLVNHESSHREACRLNVHAWANLTTFQLSTDEPYASAQPFAIWHKEIMHQTLKQYRLAKTEADDYLKSGVLDGTADVSMIMVQQTMQRNQEQVIATLRDCIEGMKKAIRHAKDIMTLKAFLIDSDVVHLLELPHLEDHRLVSVIKETLTIVRDYTTLQRNVTGGEVSQPLSDESQDYGDFPDLDDLENTDYQVHHSMAKQSVLDFIQAPLWHLVSNAFGAETSPDEDFLVDCVNTWVCVAKEEVASGIRSWSYYLDSYSQVSWQQLRHTEQTRKFGPYFLAVLINCDSTAYEEHHNDFVKALLLSLVEREALLRFQDRLLHAIAQKEDAHPLVKNLPFFRSKQSGNWDITSDTVRARRLAVISSMLSNMRDDVFATSLTSAESASEMRRTYAPILKDLMTTMKNNYQQLGQRVTGAYVEFVQRIVQFLKQYTSEICPVLPFFTDSITFPLPAADPTYVVGRLCGYAPKATGPGTAKQLSVFIQTVAQQAAFDNQHSYLVNQLTVALCTDEATAVEKVALKAVLLRGIFPIYLEEAFFSRTAFTIARPILQSLSAVLDTTIFDLRISQLASVSFIVDSIISISYAFIRGTERTRDDASLLRQPHVISTLNYMLEAMISILPLLEYIIGRLNANACARKHPLVTYMEEYSVFIKGMIHDKLPQEIPFFEGDASVQSRDKQCGELLEFCKTGLMESMKMNWSESHGAIWFGHGHARREVVIDVGSLEDENARLVATIGRFHGAVRGLNSDELDHDGGRSFGNDIVV